MWLQFIDGLIKLLFLKLFLVLRIRRDNGAYRRVGVFGEIEDDVILRGLLKKYVVVACFGRIPRFSREFPA